MTSTDVLIESPHQRLSELRDRIEPIQGWIDYRAGSELYRLARYEAPTATVVEIGSWKGRSTAWLASGLKDRGEGCVYAIDTWLGSKELEHQKLLMNYAPGQLRDEFLENMRRLDLSSYVQAVEDTSVSAARKLGLSSPIGLLFIDGAHDYESVRADFESWSPLLAPGGFAIFDDATWPGPLQVILELPRWFTPIVVSVNQMAFRKTTPPALRFAV
jgi:predicted O-methyltransferase YrrM